MDLHRDPLDLPPAGLRGARDGRAHHVLDSDVAQALRDVGLRWEPNVGDRFVLPDGTVDDLFLIASMVVEVQSVGTTRLIAFNGTTEWALDMVVASEALWLPRETDLRLALGTALRALRRRGDGWEVDVVVDGGERSLADEDAVRALGRALVEVLAAG